MSKAIRITTLCMIAFLLFSVLSYTIARPIPTSNTVTPIETHRTAEKVEAVENCTGVGEEECLMRRTRAAHLDYIYTNNNQP
ncbi:putative phytosulfokine [Helianthus annuus]|nr:putative phytosulfokine [Helianthus annuus]